MDKPDAVERREDLDHMNRPRLTPRPDGGGDQDEPMAEVLKRDDDARPGTAAESPDHAVPLTESQRAPRESLAGLIPTPDAERPGGDGQDTPPVAP